MNRQEHLQWAKDRAIQYLEIDEIFHSWNSFCNDMRKHDELSNHAALSMGTMMMLQGFWKNKEECKKYIEGFN